MVVQRFHDFIHVTDLLSSHIAHMLHNHTDETPTNQRFWTQQVLQFHYKITNLFHKKDKLNDDHLEFNHLRHNEFR